LPLELRGAANGDHRDAALDELSGKLWQPLITALGPTVFEGDVLAVNVAGNFQPLNERRGEAAGAPGRRTPTR
jgi:hypothetical protein